MIAESMSAMACFRQLRNHSLAFVDSPVLDLAPDFAKRFPTRTVNVSQWRELNVIPIGLWGYLVHDPVAAGAAFDSGAV
jgi:hypothetical protein